MARVAFVLASDYEDSEFRVPYDRLRQAGHEVTVVGVKASETLKGKKGQDTVTVEKAAGQVSADVFDALVIPGGYSPDKLRTHPEVVAFVRKLAEQGKPVAAICHAGSLLIEAQLVKGKRVTSWPSIRTDLLNAGARWEDRPVVEDQNLITSRHPGDLDAFCQAILNRLGAPAAARA